MLRAFLNRIRGRFSSNRAKARRGTHLPRRTVLSVETLEGRELMNAGVLPPAVPDVFLSPGQQKVVNLPASEANSTALTYQVDYADPQLQADHLRQQLGLHSNGIYPYNKLGAREKWLPGAGGLSYYLLPDGELWQWNHSTHGHAGLSGPDDYVALLDSSFWARPSKLANAPLPPLTASLTGSQLTVSATATASGDFALDLLVGDGSAMATLVETVHVGNQPPVLSAIPDQTMVLGQPLTLTLSASDAEGDPITYTVQASGTGSALYNLEQQYGLYFTGSYRFNTLHDHERWLHGAGKHWYFITPDGSLYAWNGRSRGTPSQAGTWTASVGTAVYADPSLLWNAPPPAVQASVSGDQLTVTAGPGYTAAFTVQVSASDGLNAVSESFKVTIVTVVPPTVAISNAPASSPEGTDIDLIAAFTNPGTASTFTYAWSVTQNGQTYAAGASAGCAFTPNDDGTYLVNLTVTGNDGGTATDARTIAVTNVAPQPAISGPTQPVNEGDIVALSGSATDPGSADTISYDWTVSKGGQAYATGTGQAISFPAADAGTYVATFTATDDDGASGTVSDTIVVANVPPQVAITGAPSDSPEGTVVSLASTVTDPGSHDTFSYAWAVTKNGAAYATGTDPSFSFIPDHSGSYVVMLTVTDKDGGTDTASQSVTVTSVAPQVAINGARVTSPEGTPINLTSTVTDPGSAETFTYAWSVTKNGNAYATGTDAGFSFNPDDGGTYVVTLTVSDDGGASGIATQTITVRNVPPQAALSGAPASSPEGTAINLTGTATDPGSADTFTYAWAVTQDGAAYATGAGSSFSFTPNDDGSYVVTLTVTDKNGGTGTASQTIAVTSVPPQVAIGGAPASSPEGAAIHLTSAVTDASSADTFTYGWTVTKDGAGYSAGQGDTFSFEPDSSGTYAVTLVVTLDDGSTGTVTQTITVDPATSQIVDGQGVAYRMLAGSDALQMNGGSGWQAVDSGVRSFQVSACGTFYQKGSDLYLHADGSGNTLPVGSGVKSFAVLNQGQELALLDDQGNVYRGTYNPPGSWGGIQPLFIIQPEEQEVLTVYWTGQTDLAVDTQGRLVLLGGDGTLSRTAASSMGSALQTLDTGVQSFQLGTNGVFYQKGSDLYLYNDGAGQAVDIASGVVRYALLNQGRQLALLDSMGNVYYGTYTPGSGPANGGGIQPFFLIQPEGMRLLWTSQADLAVDNQGLLVMLGQDGRLTRTLSKDLNSATETLDTGVKSFQVAADGICYQKNAALYLCDTSDDTWAVAGQVQRYTLLNQGQDLVYLDNQGNVYAGQYTPRTTQIMTPLLLTNPESIQQRWSNEVEIGGDALGRLLLLDNNGQLSRMVHDAADSDLQTLATGVTYFAIGNDGGVYSLQNGTLYNTITGAVVNVVSVLRGQPRPSVAAMTQALAGKLYVVVQGPALNGHAGSESLYLYDPATGLSDDFGAVQGFGFGNDDTAYYLQNGNLMHNGPGANFTIDSVQTFGFRSDGNIYVLHTNNDLTLYAPNGMQLLDFGIVQGFAMGSDGSAIFLQNGNLRRDTAQQTLSLGTASSFAMMSDGTVYAVSTQGSDTVLMNWTEQTGWTAVPNGNGATTVATHGNSLDVLFFDGTLKKCDPADGWSVLGYDTQYFAIDTGGTVYSLDSYGNIWMQAATSATASEVDRNAKSFTLGGDGLLNVLGKDGNLWQERAGWQQFGRTWVDGNVQSFCPVGDGSYLVLGSNGNLFHEAPGWQQSGRILLGYQVSFFVTGANDSLYYFDSTGNLWQKVSINTAVDLNGTPVGTGLTAGQSDRSLVASEVNSIYVHNQTGEIDISSGNGLSTQVQTGKSLSGGEAFVMTLEWAATGAVVGAAIGACFGQPLLGGIVGGILTGAYGGWHIGTTYTISIGQ